MGSAGDVAALTAARERIEFSSWASRQVSDLRKLQFQVADKSAARALVELHNNGAFEAGLIVVGTLCYMAWLNELGAKAVAARTEDIDLARRQPLKLAVPLPFLQTVQATKLPFVVAPGMPSQPPPTSVKLPGREGLRVDLLAPSRTLGATVRIPEMEWHAQGVPHYEYLLDHAVEATVLAGGACIAVRLPKPERWVWHKLYSSVSRQGSPEKATKDLLQAVTLAAILIEQNDELLDDSVRQAPAALRAAAKKRLPAIRRALQSHPQALDQFERALG